MGEQQPYVGRLAPSPTGLLHVGHARTFKVAQRRARERGGRFLLRIEDLDAPRCKPQFLPQMLEDLAWVGISWDNDALQPEYSQSTRKALYLNAWRRLYELGCVYPSPHSRKDVEKCLSAPHESDGGDPVFPTELRPAFAAAAALQCEYPPDLRGLVAPTRGVNWRLRVPDGRAVCFTDGSFGPQCFTAGEDFGDFVVWSGASDMPSYELAVVVDDLEMGVTEVVRGKDLLLSTARQLLLVEALSPLFGRGGKGGVPLSYYHCPLVLDSTGLRMAKRTPQTTLKGLREAGVTPQDAEAQALVEEG